MTVILDNECSECDSESMDSMKNEMKKSGFN